VSGTIYVGFILTDGDSINIGYDWNDNHEFQTFYNIGGIWNYSDYTGSVMMRPVFGKKNFNAVTNITDNQNQNSVTLYPNPATDEISLSPAMKPNTVVRIYGADGRLWHQDENFSGTSLNTAALPSGCYIVQIIPKDSKEQYKKLLISR